MNANQAERMHTALSNITMNAKLISDPDMGGTTDIYSVPIDDVCTAIELLLEIARDKILKEIFDDG